MEFSLYLFSSGQGSARSTVRVLEKALEGVVPASSLSETHQAFDVVLGAKPDQYGVSINSDTARQLIGAANARPKLDTVRLIANRVREKIAQEDYQDLLVKNDQGVWSPVTAVIVPPPVNSVVNQNANTTDQNIDAGRRPPSMR